MPCPSESILANYCEGRLAGAAAAELHDHLIECSACSQVASVLKVSETGATTPARFTLAGPAGVPRPGPKPPAVTPPAPRAVAPRPPAPRPPGGPPPPTRLGHSDLNSAACDRFAEAMGFALIDPLVGVTLGSYHVERRLGEGGMSLVYLARHTLIDRQVAVKFLRPELSKNEPLVQRFFHEARATANIRHPGIVQVFDFGHHSDGRAYYVMEFLAGKSLADFISSHPEHRLPVELAVDLCRQIAAVMSAAHRQGIVHRDLKPENAMLVADAEAPHGQRVKVVDFGIAKLRSESLADGLGTHVGMLLGTPRYMSPEQCVDAKSVDGRADIYSLACILFEMLSGRPPFLRTSSGELLRAHVETPPPVVSSLVPGVPLPIEQLIAWALSKNPHHRPANMDVFIEALGATTSIRTMVRRATPKIKRRLPISLSIVGGALATAAILVATARSGPSSAVTVKAATASIENEAASDRVDEAPAVPVDVRVHARPVPVVEATRGIGAQAERPEAQPQPEPVRPQPASAKASRQRPVAQTKTRAAAPRAFHPTSAEKPTSMAPSPAPEPTAKPVLNEDGVFELDDEGQQ